MVEVDSYWYRDKTLLIAAKKRWGTFAGIEEATGTDRSVTRLWWQKLGCESLQRGPKPKQANREALEELHKAVYGPTYMDDGTLSA